MSRTVPDSVRQSARTLEDAYTQMCVASGSNPGQCSQPPRTLDPTQLPAISHSYMTGGDGRDINIAPLFDNNNAVITYLRQQLGYDQAAGERVDTEVRTRMGNGQSMDQINSDYINSLSVADRRSYEIYKTERLLSFFRETYVESDPNHGGNRDNNPNVISDMELRQWAWARAATEVGADASDTNNAEIRARYEVLGRDVIARFHALMGLAVFLQQDPPPPPRTLDTRVLETHTTDPVNFAAPQGGWQTGDQVFVNGTAYTPLVPLTGTQQLTIPPTALRNGDNTIEVRNNGQTWVTMPVRLNTPVAPEQVTTSTSWWDSPSHQHWVEAGAVTTVAIIGTFFGARWLGRRGGEARAVEADAARVKADALTAEATARVDSLTKQIADVNGALAVVPDANIAPREAELTRLNSELSRAQAELTRLNGQSSRPPLKNNVSDQQFNDASDAYTRAHDARLEQEAELDRAESSGDQAQIEAAQAELTNRQQAEAAALNNVARMIRGKSGNTQAMAEGYLTARRLQAEIVTLQSNIATLEGQIAAPRAIARARGFLGAQPAAPTP